MRKLLRAVGLGLLAGAGLAGAMLAAPGAVSAQDTSSMGCHALWYARNAIYARNGYCFQTQDAISVFGTACFPPFGKLSGDDAERVRDLQYWERRKGC